MSTLIFFVAVLIVVALLVVALAPKGTRTFWLHGLSGLAVAVPTVLDFFDKGGAETWQQLGFSPQIAGALFVVFSLVGVVFRALTTTPPGKRPDGA